MIPVDYKLLREMRKRKRLTQDEMAKKIGYSSKSGYCMIEKGTNGMSVETASKIIEVLGEEARLIFFKQKVHDTPIKSSA